MRATSLTGRYEVDLVAELLRLRPAWQADALCREYGTRVMFSTTAAGQARAVEVCSRCAVLEECRRWAVTDDAPELGVVGGLPPAERARLRRNAVA
jgi:hypothetical protein